MKGREIISLVAGILLLLGLPLIGVGALGEPVTRYLEFPPRTQYVTHAGFSWLAFLVLAPVALGLLLTVLVPLAQTGQGAARPREARRPFPGWGWFGIGLLGAAWILSWTRFPWAKAIQPYTFTPLWLGYILGINALTYRRTGSCMLTAAPRYVLLLFPVSAAFWWYFEYLNRFVQNWTYEGIGALSSAGYFWMASLAFSTVLPAVLGTEEWVRAMRGRGPAAAPDAVRRIPRAVPMGLLLFSAAGLALLAVFPDLLFPLLWLAPLLVLAAVRMLSGQPMLDAEAGEALAPRLARFALAALICGFFWEMWNVYSQARWVYAVPYVNRFHLFEMPILGYAGYLPFGLECALIGDLVSHRCAGIFKDVP